MIKSNFEALYQNLDGIREFVGALAQDAGLSEREIYAVQLATDEASTNIIEHAYRGEEKGTIEIECEVLPGKLLISLRDHGRSFDPVSVPEPNVKADIHNRKVGGLGMYLIRKLMDEVHYETSEGEGNRLRLVKYSENAS